MLCVPAFFPPDAVIPQLVDLTQAFRCPRFYRNRLNESRQEVDCFHIHLGK